MPSEEGRYVATPELMRSLIDENTIGLAAVGGRVAWAAALPACQLISAAAAAMLHLTAAAVHSCTCPLLARLACLGISGADRPPTLSPPPPSPPPPFLCCRFCCLQVLGSTYNGEFEDVEAMDALCTGGWRL